jgi:hypothetical protein
MQDRPDAIARFAWALRRYWPAWVAAFLVTVLLVVGTGTLLMDEEEYTARALIVPRTLGDDLDPLRLSRFQQAVFDSGGVIEAALADEGVPYEDRLEMLEYVRLVPVEDNIALNVAVTDTDPDAAADIANVVAENLVRALNRAGPSAGSFVVHTEASTPAIPDPRQGMAVIIAVGVIGGFGAAVGLAGTIGALRRPLLSPTDVMDVLDEPTVGRVRLAVHRRVEPTEVLGLSALVRRVYPTGAGTCAFVAPANSHAAKLQIASLVARVLARHRPTLYVASDDGSNVGEELLIPGISVRPALDVGTDDEASVPTVVEGPEAGEQDLPQLLPGDAAIVVVVAEGEPTANLERLGQQFLSGEIIGALFVEPDRRRWLRKSRRTGYEARIEPAPEPDPLPRG